MAFLHASHLTLYLRAQVLRQQKQSLVEEVSALKVQLHKVISLRSAEQVQLSDVICANLPLHSGRSPGSGGASNNAMRHGGRLPSESDRGSLQSERPSMSQRLVDARRNYSKARSVSGHGSMKQPSGEAAPSSTILHALPLSIFGHAQ